MIKENAQLDIIQSFRMYLLTRHIFVIVNHRHKYKVTESRLEIELDNIIIFRYSVILKYDKFCRA